MADEHKKNPKTKSPSFSFRVAKLSIFLQSHKFYTHKFEICRKYSKKQSILTFLKFLGYYFFTTMTNPLLYGFDRIATSDVPRFVLVAAVLELGDILAQSLQALGAERKGLLLVGSVDSGNIPCGAALACDDGTFGRIASEEYGLVPCCRQFAQVVLHLLWLCQETLGTVGQVLQATFEEGCERQLVCVRGDMRML